MVLGPSQWALRYLFTAFMKLLISAYAPSV